METLKAIFTGIKKNISKSKEREKQPITIFAETDYDFGLDVLQKVLFVICVLPILMTPLKNWSSYIMWPIGCSVIGFCILNIPFQKIFKKKTQEIQNKEKAFRFLCIPQKIWSWVVALCLLTFYITNLIISPFEVTNLVLYPLMFFINHAILAKKVSLAYNECKHAHDPNVVGTEEWVKANNLERVYGVGDSIVYRDKNGNYYEHNIGNIAKYKPIPAPVTIKKDK